jgi:TetR/AcrR family transcriptional regulator, tetracycline repressor protein
MKASRTASDTLSRDAVVERALSLADAEGLDAVTIRRLGQEFGVTPMALYWHVKNKEELLDAMGDRMFAGIDLDYGSTASWDKQLAAVVQALVGIMRAHPTCVDLSFRRVFACPEGLQAAEHTLGLLRRAGFAVRQAVDIASRALQTAVMLVRAEPGAEPGTSEEERRQRVAAKRRGLLALPVEQFPYIHETIDDLLAYDDMDAYYDVGVDLFIAGVRAQLASVRKQQTASTRMG